MSLRAEEIYSILSSTLSPISLQVEDESWKHKGHAGAKESGGGHFIVRITANIFKNKSRLQCHRIIYDALRTSFSSDIHALSIDAKAP